MKKYESKRHPGTFLTTDGIVDEKTKTVFVTLEGGVVQSMNIATLKRWWTPVAETANTPETEEPETVEAAETPAVEPEAESAEPEAVESTEAPAAELEAESAELEAPVEDTTPEEPKEKPARKKAEKKPKESIDHTEDLEKLNTLYDKLNDLYFDGELIKADISISDSKRGKKHCATSYDPLTESAGIVVHMTDDETQLAVDLCHNMVHLFCMVNDIKETCQKGRYHNGAFHTEAEARDLHVIYDSANGWATTEATENFISKVLS